MGDGSYIHTFEKKLASSSSSSSPVTKPNPIKLLEDRTKSIESKIQKVDRDIKMNEMINQPKEDYLDYKIKFYERKNILIQKQIINYNLISLYKIKPN